LSDDEYKELQAELIARPDAGSLIPGSGGLRKLRWRVTGHGKRGGMRVIYYWHVPDFIFMLIPFMKNEAEDLTKDQLGRLRQTVEKWLQ
jgi:hypothetical protein